MQVFHTAGVPPSSGSTMRLNIGCTRKRRNALVKIAAVYTASTAPPAAGRTGTAAGADDGAGGACELTKGFSRQRIRDWPHAEPRRHGERCELSASPRLRVRPLVQGSRMRNGLGLHGLMHEYRMGRGSLRLGVLEREHRRGERAPH